MFTLLINSGIYIGYAINQIRKHLTSNENSADVDVRILAVHATAFGLYMVSIIVNFIFLAYYYLTGSTNSTASIYSDMFCVFSSFIAQVFLCGILWTLSHKKS